MIKIKVDDNGKCETPVGIAGRQRPRRLSSCPTEKEHPEVVII
jgi:hypothetical protein